MTTYFSSVAFKFSEIQTHITMVWFWWKLTSWSWTLYRNVARKLKKVIKNTSGLILQDIRVYLFITRPQDLSKHGIGTSASRLKERNRELEEMQAYVNTWFMRKWYHRTLGKGKSFQQMVLGKLNIQVEN